jgi:hypothetical protein
MKKRTSHLPTILNWSFWSLLFFIFSWWHGAFQQPLTAEEVNTYAKKLHKRLPEQPLEVYQQQLANDNGSPIFMVNVIKYFDSPVKTKDQQVAMEAEKLVKTYNNYVGKFLIKRGSYPIFLGKAAGGTAAAWGVDEEDMEGWSEVAIVRYRNIRTMMELATDDQFNQNLTYKHTALEKTIIFPTESTLMPGRVEFMMFFMLLSAGLAIQLILNSKRTSRST